MWGFLNVLNYVMTDHLTPWNRVRRRRHIRPSCIRVDVTLQPFALTNSFELPPNNVNKYNI